MNKCTNLRNLYSYCNIYKRDDIVPLKNIRRIFSWDDKYKDSNSSFLYDVFENNKLEFVYVWNE